MTLVLVRSWDHAFFEGACWHGGAASDNFARCEVRIRTGALIVFFIFVVVFTGSFVISMLGTLVWPYESTSLLVLVASSGLFVAIKDWVTSSQVPWFRGQVHKQSRRYKQSWYLNEQIKSTLKNVDFYLEWSVFESWRPSYTGWRDERPRTALLQHV